VEIIQPIFNKQIEMWNKLKLNINIEEGYYWLDNGLIKAFEKETAAGHW
jgi:hypothetical protein